MIEKTHLLNFDEPESPKTRFEAIKEHLYTEMKGEGVILNLKNGKYYGVNQVGDSIWKTIQSPATLQEIEIALIREYEVDAESCRQAIIAFLEQMVSQELITVLNEKDS